MKLAFVLMLTFCLFLQTQEARKIDDESYYEKLKNDPNRKIYDESYEKIFQKDYPPECSGVGHDCVASQDCCKRKTQIVYCDQIRGICTIQHVRINRKRNLV